MILLLKLHLSADGSNLFDIMELLSPLESCYYSLGMALRLGMEYLEDTEEKFGETHSKALRKVVVAWLQQRYDVAKFGPPTWRMLVEAVDSRAGGNHRLLAVNIAQDHPASESN